MESEAHRMTFVVWYFVVLVVVLNVLVAKGRYPFRRLIGNARKCTCFLHVHMWNGLHIALNTVVWVPLDWDRAYWYSVGVDFFAISFSVIALWFARHDDGHDHRTKRAPAKKWVDLVRSWRKPVAIPV